MYSNLYSHPTISRKPNPLFTKSFECLSEDLFGLIVNAIFANPDYRYDAERRWQYVFDNNVRYNRDFCIRKKIDTLKIQDQENQIYYVPLYNMVVVIDQYLLSNLLPVSKTIYLKTKACIEQKRILCDYYIQYDRNVFEHWGCTRNLLLYQAVYNKWRNVIAALLKYGIHPHAYDGCGTTVMHEAVRCGSKKTLTMLRDHGGSINVPDIYGYTPLHIACGADAIWHDQLSGISRYNVLQSNKEKRLKIIAQLLEWGADINAQNYFGSTPLHIATDREHQEVVDFLHKCGADSEIKNMLQKAQGET